MSHGRLGHLAVRTILTCGFAFAAAVASAQQFKANITGTVSDTQGALIPGVTVTVTNTETNVAVESVPDTNGGFSVKDVVPGPYKVTAALQGFKTFVREGIIL